MIRRFLRSWPGTVVLSGFTVTTYAGFGLASTTVGLAYSYVLCAALTWWATDEVRKTLQVVRTSTRSST